MPFEIVPANTHFDFIGKRRLALFVSLGLLAVAAAAVFVNGIRLGIDFAGGNEIQVKFDAGVPADEGRIRGVAGTLPGVEGLAVVRFGELEDNEFLIKFKSDTEDAIVKAPAETPAPAGEEADAEEAAEPPVIDAAPVVKDRVVLLGKALEKEIGAHIIQRVEFVGPRVGKELRNDGLSALLIASFFILLYIWFRFTLRFSPGAIAAVVHDLLITAGIFVILGMEFDLRILAAMLAIMGYSLNDTIIIYDRIRENMELRTSYDLPEVLNESVNQTLSRTVLTSGTTIVALLSLFLLGGEVIQPFAVAMLIGVVVGTYSSVYIAAPVLLWLETRFGDGPSAGKGSSKPRGGQPKTRAARA